MTRPKQPYRTLLKQELRRAVLQAWWRRAVYMGDETGKGNVRKTSDDGKPNQEPDTGTHRKEKRQSMS